MTLASNPNHKRLRRPCKRCGEMFQPSGKGCWICEKCNKNIIRQRKKKQKYKLSITKQIIKYKNID